MLDDIWVDDSVLALRPDFAVLVMTAHGLRNGPSDDRSRAWLTAASACEVQTEKIDAWKDAYRAFGAKPQRTRPSVDALTRRMPLPEINRAVDAYNSISVRHALPIGGEDLDRYVGPARLVRASGDEASEEALGQPEPGEVIWRDDAGVTCRRWNWRQVARTRLTEETTNAIFMLERLEPMSLEELKQAGEELADLLAELSPEVRITSRLLLNGN
ncbi:B3/B4 domain-containing protein (DNA/RNA-binding domain of Phe-tRNA-synthetase) [Nonomuraea maritima]|uniref:B3/B4 domain-containing protein (DNA/RNA-binding domain of Phe-tRNA-synthetase) n=1 Tax=Nonomuraea maritima TaxID=683260 RepID=A0A1G9NTP1_9ACTN|nr:phenylalanine--tRNA ligase beta subunit-related protein [Nonomuraea maritima]SDL89942.1 B3/B4 domain-containing protein (DNA/RNA-binding domain of Phe-tRNA-synthetase) [Nonomuraea maritima]